jgi:hypothetical protein
MIFDVLPSQIEKLDSNKLVVLLNKLLHAEAQCIGIPLRGVSVPLQITTPDGGEDARFSLEIKWTEYLEQTNYLPSRFCIFQSKATNLGKAGWKKEVWTKKSQKKGSQRELNAAVTDVIAKKGFYIGFTSAPIVDQEKKKLIEAINQGIREAGGNADQIGIDIYDANKIATWVSQYPAIAVWLNEQESGLNLKSYETIESLGEILDISKVPLVEDKSDRFQIVDSKERSSLSFHKTKERIVGYLADPRRTIRIYGASGLGKTRFVYEVFKDKTTIVKLSLSVSTVYCDLEKIGHKKILTDVESFSASSKLALIIVDNCPRETASKLNEIVKKESSNLKIITIGNDNQPIDKDDCLNISVTPADETLIEGIIRQRYPKADNSDIEFIKNLSDGYPRIAVLATDNYSEGLPILKSIEDVVERILKGCGITCIEQVRAIECLALFTELGADETISEELDFVAQNLARQTGDEMYEYLAQATKSFLVDYNNSYIFTAKPLPIANFLGLRRLDLLRVKNILNFIENAPPRLQSSFLKRWEYFDTSKTLAKVTESLLARDGLCSSLESLNTNIGLQCLDALVHIDPIRVAYTIERIFGKLSIDELQQVQSGKDYLINVLAKLVFRQNTFHIAARLLLKLAAVEKQTMGNSSTSIFTQLFQIYLSGTEVEPSERFRILDDQLNSNDERIVKICIEALQNTIQTSYLGWTGDSNKIGTQPPLKHWNPETWDELFDFIREGLQRLNTIRVSNKVFACKCEEIIAFNIRGLISYESLIGDVENILQDITKDKGIWFEAIKGIGDWLYYDRKKGSETLSLRVRKLYDTLLPTDLIQLALLYTKFWQMDIHDPKSTYDTSNRTDDDFEYSSKKAKEIAAKIAVNQDLTYQTIQIMVQEQLNNVYPFAYELAIQVENPLRTFQIAVEEFEKFTDHKGIQFLRGLISGIDKRGNDIVARCIQIAHQSDSLKNQMVHIYNAIDISAERLNEIVQQLKDGSINAPECVYFSYGRGLDSLDVKEILPLINELYLNHESVGIWTALEIIFMYQLNRTNLDKQLAQRIKQLLTDPKLLKIGRIAINHGYIFKQLTLLVQEFYGIDNKFAIGLIDQVVRLCQVNDIEIFHTLDNDFQSVIQELVKEKPILLWNALSNFFEIATLSEISYLEELVRYPRHRFDGESPGIIFGIPETEYINWAKINPKARSPFLCAFYPIIDMKDSGESQWHPALIKLTNEFGEIKEFRDALESRIPIYSYRTKTPKLETYLTLFKSWSKHPKMFYWVKDMINLIEHQIDKEKKRTGGNP